MVKEDEFRRRAATFSVAPWTPKMIKAIATFFGVINPDQKWSDGRSLDAIAETTFFRLVQEALENRFPGLAVTHDDGKSRFQFGDRGALVESISLEHITMRMIDPPLRDFTKMFIIDVGNLIGQLSEFFTFGQPPITVFFPSYGNPIDGMPTVVMLVDFATGASHAIETLSAPNADLPPLGALAVIRKDGDEYRGTIEHAEIMTFNAALGPVRSMHVFVTKNRPSNLAQ